MTLWQSRNIPRSNRRSGGREARRNVRSAPLAEELRPVRAGMTGGTFRPLDAAAVDASHQPSRSNILVQPYMYAL